MKKVEGKQIESAMKFFEDCEPVAVVMLSADYLKRTILPMLCELKQRRKAELRPARKAAQGLTIMEQIDAIESEVRELRKAARIYAEQPCDETRLALGLEAFDVQTAAETALDMLEFRGEAKANLFRLGLAKNAERGYYE